MELLILLAFISIVFLALFRSRKKSVSKKSIKKTLHPSIREQVNASENTTPRYRAEQKKSSATVHNYKKVNIEYIIDGDTVVVSDSCSEYKIRLDGIDCPEDGQHWGDIAKYGLIKLIGDCIVFIEEHGTDVYGRTLATLYINHRTEHDLMNVNERMVTLGHAWVMRRYNDHIPKDRQDQLNRLEKWARTIKAGLWNTPNPVPPWQWRNS